MKETALEVWLYDNLYWMLPLALTVLALLGAGFVKAGIQDWRASRRDQEEITRIMESFTGEQKTVEPTYVPPNPTLVIWSGPKHLAAGESWEDEPSQSTLTDEEGYIGLHRLPENLTAQQHAALFTQTREVPLVRTLAPTWRQVVTL